VKSTCTIERLKLCKVLKSTISGKELHALMTLFDSSGNLPLHINILYCMPLMCLQVVKLIDVLSLHLNSSCATAVAVAAATTTTLGFYLTGIYFRKSLPFIYSLFRKCSTQHD